MNFMCLFAWVLFPISILVLAIGDQDVQLESTIVRCNHDEMLEDGTPKNPLQLASSFKGHPKLNPKFDSKCRKKLLITLRVMEYSENFVPNALILIDRAKNALTQKSSRFGLPIAVKFHQEILLQRYALKYLYRVNGKMWEEVINIETNKNFTGCIDSFDNSRPPTCGYVPGSGSKQVAGFCCSCNEHRNSVQQRGGQRCDIPGKTAEQLSSAHCLHSSPYWYNVYEILPPSLYQKLNFEVFKSHEHSNGSISWERMSNNEKGVQINSDAPMNAVGAVNVTYRPHVEGIEKSIMLFNSSSQRLLFPLPYPFGSDHFPDPDPLRGPIEEQMLIVPKTLMSPHGSTCDHVGTHIDAFLKQPEPCRHERNSCLQNQPFDLWKQDQGPRGDPESKFRLNSFQTNYPPFVDFAEDYKSGFIYVEHKGDAPTYVDIEIPADEIAILAPGYNAFIESVFTDTGSDGAKVITQVINKELVEATFSVELVQCSLNFSAGDNMTPKVEMKSPQKKIGPLNAKYFDLDLHSPSFTLPTTCYVVLVNEYAESIAAREVTLKPYETCRCVHICKCACGEEANLKCEKMSDENIIATGLISAIKTAVQVETEEASQFTRKYRWIFYWILVFHIILLIVAFCGWAQKQCGKPKSKKVKMPRSRNNDQDETSSTSASSDTSEVILFDKPSPSDNKFYEEIADIHQNLASGKSISETKLNQLIETTKTIIASGGDPNQEGHKSLTQIENDSGKDIGVGNNSSRAVTFASELELHQLPSEVSTASSINVIKGKPSHFQTASTSKVESSDTQKLEASSISLPNMQSTATPTPSSVPQQRSAQSASQSLTPSVTQTSPSLQSDKVPSHATTLTNVTKGNTPSSSSSRGKGNEQGPQTIDSSDLWTHKTDSNHNSMEDFINYCVSASSSKTSFGTWHRKRRDQYSAYDFLPQPKQRDSWMND